MCFPSESHIYLRGHYLLLSEPAAHAVSVLPIEMTEGKQVTQHGAMREAQAVSELRWGSPRERMAPRAAKPEDLEITSRLRREA